MGLSKEFLRDLMDNPNFKKWFGESAVRDTEGLPLEVYHGTGSTGIMSFLPRGGEEEAWQSSLNHYLDAKSKNQNYGYFNFRDGTYFSPDPKYADHYAAENTGVIYPGFLKAENPVYMDAKTRIVSGVNPNATPDAFMLRDGDKILEATVIDPTQFKSRFNAGTFDPTDPNFLKSLGLMTAGTGAAAYAMSPDDAEAASLEQILRAARTARSAGAVSEKAIVPRYIMENLTPEEAGKVLDFGSGPAAKHAEMLRGKGYDVSAYDFNPSPGASDPKALEKGPYDTIYASNVLNTQQSPEMLAETLSQLKSALSQSGQIFANYPSSPRYMGLGTNDFKPMIERVFSSVEPVLGRDTGKTSTPIWRILPAALGLAGSSVYALSPDDAEAAKLDAKKIIMNIMRKHDPYESKFYDLGLRRNTNIPGEVPTSLRVGDELSPSRRWYDGDPTDEVLSGTSTVGLSDKNVDEAMRRIKGYSSDDPNLYIVGGDSAMGGEDVGEKVLTNAKVAGRFSPDKYNFALPLGLVGAATYGLMSSDNDAEASVPSALARDLVEGAGKAAERGSAAPPREWARETGNNTPNVAQAITPTDSSQLATAAALIAALKSKDQPLEDTYQPADLLTAFLTGGGGMAGRSIQAALDPVFSAAMDYAPRVADAINPRNIIMGLMR